MHIDLTLQGRRVEFDMTYDPSFAADQATRYFLERDACCEPEVAHLMARVLREGDTAVDVGANVGFFTLLMSRLVGSSGRVLAFEPGVNNICKLSDNVGLNRMQNVTMHAVPLWSRNQEVTFYTRQDSGLNSLVSDDLALSGTKMQAEMLDAYCRGVAPRLIKIDAEGAEEHILRGAESLAQVEYVACELNALALEKFGSSGAALSQYMYEGGYQMFLLHPDGALPTLVPLGTTLLTNRLNLNVMFSTVGAVGRAWPQVIA